MGRRGRKPTRRQKEYISGNGLDADHWLVESEDGSFLYLMNKTTGKSRRASKEKKERRNYGKS